MKIALITPWHVRCGIANYSSNLAPALADLGVDVHVVRMPRFGPKSPEIMQDVVDRIPFDKIDVIHVEHEYGIWQGFDSTFFPALKRLNKPIVTTMHAVGNWDADDGIARCSDRVVVHNKFCFDKFNHPENTVIIPHGAKPAECAPKEEAKKLYGITSQLPIVGYCGFISNYKGIETLIEAMKKVPAALVIAGGWFVDQETGYISQLKDYSLKTLEGRCQWIGFIPDDQLPYAYGLMDVVVYPSRYATESGALIMAMSHGKAIIATDISPFKEKGKKTYPLDLGIDLASLTARSADVPTLLTFKDAEDLKNKLTLLLKSEEGRRQLEWAAKKYAEENSWYPNIAEKHLRLYEECLNAARGEIIKKN